MHREFQSLPLGGKEGECLRGEGEDYYFERSCSHVVKHYIVVRSVLQLWEPVGIGVSF